MNPAITIAHLPKDIQKIPAVRALTLKVYESGQRRYQVPGRERIYDVWVDYITKELTCTCQATPRCAHIIAVRNHEKGKQNAH